jgi:hypothetical protein
MKAFVDANEDPKRCWSNFLSRRRQIKQHDKLNDIENK